MLLKLGMDCGVITILPLTCEGQKGHVLVWMGKVNGTRWFERWDWFVMPKSM